MGLYERDYARTGFNTNTRTDGGVISFVKETYKLFGASMVAGAAGAYVGVPMAASVHDYSIMLFILEIALLIGLFVYKKTPVLNLALLFSFTFMTGITLAPLLSSVLGMSGGSAIVGNAFAMTSVVFGAMSLFAIKTKQDFTGYGKPLMIAMIVVIVFSLLNAFVMQSSLMSIVISGAVTLLFSVMVVFDTQNIINGNYETPIEGAVALYIDFLNIFTSLLHLFGIFGSDD
jgi:modulator of FtsH protease